jgi:hypothetical protein
MAALMSVANVCPVRALDTCQQQAIERLETKETTVT